MLYALLQPFARDLRVLNLLNYITFRSAAAFVTALLVSFVFGPVIIRRLRRLAVNQVVREGTPDTHAGKGTTPTMGGIIIVVAALLPVLLWARLGNHYVQLAVGVTLWMGAIGFLDDYLKLKQKREGKKNEGLVERYKLAGQVTCGVGLGLILWLAPISTLSGASTSLPFFKYVLLVPATASLAWLYVPWVTFVLTGTSNAVNLTDGLDGLSSGLVAIDRTDSPSGTQHGFALSCSQLCKVEPAVLISDWSSIRAMPCRARGFGPATRRPVFMSQRCTTQSAPAEASRLPSFENASVRISSVCPCKTNCTRPWRGSPQTWIAKSESATASNLPSRE